MLNRRKDAETLGYGHRCYHMFVWQSSATVVSWLPPSHKHHTEKKVSVSIATCKNKQPSSHRLHYRTPLPLSPGKGNLAKSGSGLKIAAQQWQRTRHCCSNEAV